MNYILEHCRRFDHFWCFFLCYSGQEEDGRKVLVLSYPQYCRYRSVLARLREQPSSLLIDHTVLALGGIAALGGSTRILYCRDTFEHPTLLQNESICDEFGEFGSWQRRWSMTFMEVAIFKTLPVLISETLGLFPSWSFAAIHFNAPKTHSQHDLGIQLSVVITYNHTDSALAKQNKHLGRLLSQYVVPGNNKKIIKLKTPFLQIKTVYKRTSKNNISLAFEQGIFFISLVRLWKEVL